MIHSGIYHHCIFQVDNTNYDLLVRMSEDLLDMHNFYNNRHKVFLKAKNKNKIISLDTTTKIPKYMMMVIQSFYNDGISNSVNVSCIK